MRKYSTLGVFASRMLCVCILSALLLFSNNSYSQGCPGVLPCGASPWGEPSGVLTPIANNDQFATVGSGTYSVLNTHGGGIYTFSTCGGAWADSYLTGFPVGSSACLFYNDDSGPAGCSPATKASQTYSPTVNNLINVQLNRKVSGSCQGWVSGGSSGQLTYRCAPPVAPVPATYGNGQWNVYVWNAGGQFAANAWGANAASYSGYLTTSSLNFNSLNHWASGGSPSDAASYQGCHVAADEHSWSAKRTGFTCGVYRIDIPTHDDACELYVNGVQVAAGTHIAACCDAHMGAWTGVLTATSTVEFRVSEGLGGSGGEINVVPISPTTLAAGTVGTSQTICTGGDPAAFTNNSLASGGVGTAYIGGSYTYVWGYQDNCTGGGVTVGSGTTYDAPAGLTVTRCYYRMVTDACGNDVFTTPITVTVVADPAPNTPTLTNSTICTGGSSTANVTLSGGTGSPTYSWEYFNGSTWNAVANNTPAGAVYANNTTANLSISGITATGTHQYRAQVGATGSGCGVSASPAVSLTVVADPSLSAASVATPTICTGGSTNITSTASNGTGTIAYQWEYDNGGTWVPVANGLPAGSVYVNATTATLTVSGINTAGTYNFRNTVTASGSGCNTAQSTQGTLTVVNDPAISTPVLSNPTVCTTGSSVISTTVSGGTGTQTLQWQYNNGGTWVNVSNGLPTGAVYAGNNTASLTVSGIVPLGSYQYQLVFTSAGNSCGTATSSTATLVVSAGPSVTAPSLTNSTICVGGTTSASVTATGGTGTTSYQWQYFNGSWANVVNGTPAGASYTGANGATLDVSGITATGAHQYQVIVSSSGAGCSPTTSTAATVTVVPDPTLSNPTITNTTICAGGSTTLTSNISNGTGSITYQWEYNNGGVWGAVANGLPTGAVYVNATTNSVNISGVTATGSHQYRLTATASGSGCNPATSGNVSVAVLSDPSVSTPIFTNPTLCVGGTTNVSASAINGTGSYTYQWQYFSAGSWSNVTNGVPTGVTYTNPTSSTMTIAGITATGTHQYQIIVNASGSGCDAVTSAAGTLTVNPDPAISISGTQTYCVSGSALLSSVTSGGAVTTTIQWQDSPDGVTFTNISGANGSTYTTPAVTATTYYRATYASTGNGCGTATSNIITVTVQPAIANNTIAPYQKFCASGDPVVITAGAVTGGNGSYTYAWEQSTNGGVSWTPATGTNNQPTYDPPFTSSTIRYRRIVTSGVCSSTSNDALILVLPLPQVNSVNPTDVLCFGTSTGTISVTGSTANGSVYYSRNGGSTYQVSGNFTGLPIGSYNIFVRDDSSCVNSFVANPVILNQPTDVTHTAVAIDASCANVFDGQISVTANGGITPYSYSLNGGPTQSGSTFLGLTSGTYLISVFDDNGCLDTSSITINNSYAVTGSILSQTNVSCFGGSDGAVTVQLSGGISPYVYSLNGGAFVSSQTFTGLPANLYVVTLRDSKGCTDFLSVNITQPAQLAVTIDVVNNVLCNGDTTGEIFISVNGGTPGYTYNWSNGRTTQDNLNVGVGTYLLTVTDSKGCTTFASASVTQPQLLSLSVAQVQNLRCFNDNSGRVDISVSGGVSPYTYVWSNGASTEDIINLPAGNYTVSVYDGNGCMKSVTVPVTQPVALTTTISGNTVACNGGSTGIVDLTVFGGTPGYTYLWSNGYTSQDLAGVPAGIYNVIVNDANGCTTSNTYNVAQPGSLTLSTLITNVNCFGDSTGTINLSVSGGILPYTYTWSNGATTQSILNIPAGNYNVSVVDGNGCTVTAGATVTQPNQGLATTLTQTNVTCNGANNGAVNLGVSGGTLPYSFAWSNGAGTEDLTNIGPNTYYVTVTDFKGCVIRDTAVVTEPAVLTATIVPTNVNCFGGTNGAIDLTVTGGNPGYTYLWSPFATTQDLSNLSAGTYNVVVTDTKGCQTITGVVITQPAQIVLTAVVSNVSCNGAGDGAINLTVAGGVGPFTYSWNSGAFTTQDLTSLSPGTYNVLVTDFNGCTATASYTITQPAFLNVVGVPTDVTCNGAANGAINVTITGGTTPYTIIWSNGAVTEDLTGLSGGLYDISVTDANGCTNNANFVIQEPVALTATVAPTHVTCYGGNNGVANLTATGGNPPYTFLWSNFASTEDLLNLTAGNYTVIVTDSKGCQTIAGTTITQPAQIVITAVVTNINCNGTGTGAINITATGGTGTLTYSWNGGLYTTEDLTNLGPGTYTVVVTDANLCTASATYTITQPLPLASSGTVTNVSCFGGANGAINFTITGGNAPFTYIWSNGATTEDVSGLVAGTYSVSATDANGCVALDTFSVTQPTAITSSVAGTNVTCFGASNGAATLTVGGGVTPYTFLWSTFQNTQNLSNIAGGTYYVIITDGNGCTKRDSVIIAEPAQLVLTSLDTNVLCNGATTGAVNLTVTGGTGAYTYLWSNGATTQDLTGVAAGTYTVTVTDGNGCTATRTVTLTQPAGLLLNATTTNVNCAGGANGSVDITVNGGVFPYTFAWSNGAVTEDVNGLSGGPISVTVTDANGCSISQSYIITEPAVITSSVAGTNVTCFGASNGAATLTVGGGVTPYTFLWSNFQATQNLTNISGGTYYVVITDANGCTKRDSVIIAEPAQLVLTSLDTNILCNGALTGAINLTVTGGTGTYTYLWSNGATTQDLTGVAAGTYTVTVTDGNGCTATRTVTLTQPAGLLLNATTTNVNCFGGANGSVDITVNGGVFPYTFAWSNGATTEDVNGLSGGPISVTVTDANGCSISQSYIITEPAVITSSVVGTNVTCFGASNGAATLTVGGGVTPYTFLWSNFQATQNLTNISGGTYYVVITDANGCTKRDSVIIAEPAQLVLTSLDTNILCNGALTGAINLTVTGGTGTYTYLWSNGAFTQDLTGVGAGTYTVTVTDGNGCTATRTVTLTQPAGLLLNATTTNVNCFGGANGSVDITVNGGVFPYTFAWSNGTTTEDVNGLSGGPISVTVTDANGCTISQSYNITEPTILVSSVVGTNVTCFGASNGAANLTVSGGVAPYTYLWNNFQATQDLANISGGTYYVIITDANGCTKRDSVIITEPTQLVLSTSVTNILCSGNNTGAIDLTVNGGTVNYTYLWSNGATTQDLTGLAAGPYTVTVTDANGCTATISATVSQPNALAVTGVVSNVFCAGGNDGNINLSVTGGAQPYTFLWTNGAVTEDLLNLTQGTYAVTVTDANGCTATATFNVTEPTGITSSVVGTDVACQGANNGTATLTVNGGVPPYTFFWSNFQNTQNITGLDGGIYYVIITDANGCTRRDSVIINEPSPLILSYTSNNVSCFNVNDGNIDLSVVGGISSYTYLWSNGATTQDISNLAGNTYSVTVTDNNGCTATTSVLIINPSPLAANFITQNPTCFLGNNGSINLLPTGGTPNYTFLWNTTATTEDITNLANGLYIVTITDSKNCTLVDSVNIVEPAPLVTSGFVRNVTCFGYADGFIDITAYGGTLPYTYLWSSTPSTEDIGGLVGGNYIVTVTDFNSCTVASLYVVSEPTQLTLNVTGTNLSCFGGTDGTAAAIPGGGVTPYDYLWDDFAVDSFRVNLAAGKHAVLLTDSNGCQVVDSIILTQPVDITIQGNVTNVACASAATGAIDITVGGGTPTYTYVWSNAAVTEDIGAVVAGNYAVQVTDANGCVKAAAFEITQPKGISTQLLTDQPSCFSSKNGSASVIASEGVAPYTFVWSTTPAQTGNTANFIGAGTYVVTVTDANACTVSASVAIVEPDSIAVATTATASRCFNTATGLVVADVTGGEAPYIYSLNGVTQLSDTFTNLAPGSYIIEATDVNGCSGTSIFNIAEASQITVDLTSSENTLLTGMETQLVANTTSTTPVIAYFWNPDSLINFSGCSDPANCATPYAAPRATTLYTVTVMNADSCTASDTVTIYVTDELSAFMPSVFTPNGDGLNDRFEFDVLGAEVLKVTVFDRWGGLVYSNDNQPNGITGVNGWDGTREGKLASADTYVYHLTITYFDGNTKDVSGTITLMK